MFIAIGEAYLERKKTKANQIAVPANEGKRIQAGQKKKEKKSCCWWKDILCFVWVLVCIDQLLMFN